MARALAVTLASAVSLSVAAKAEVPEDAPYTADDGSLLLQVRCAAEQGRGQASPCLPFYTLDLTTQCDKREDWSHALRRTDPMEKTVRRRIFMDVGCNTGIDAARWLEFWGTPAWTGLTVKWGEAVKNMTGEDGACNQNNLIDEIPEKWRSSWSASQGDPMVVCIEPSPTNVKVVQEAQRLLMKASSSFLLLPAAVSDTEGSGRFPKAGGEVGSLVTKSAQGTTVEVNITTVDKIVEDLQVVTGGPVQVDVLTVDTEGFDPLVLRGAERTLQHVRFLVFEVTQDLASTPWGKTRVVDVVGALDRKGLECYWAGNNGRLQPITGCWGEGEENKYGPVRWSNIACVRRGDVWHSALLPLVGHV